MSRLRLRVVLVGLLLLVPPVARAQMFRDGPPPLHRLLWRQATLGSLNPLGGFADVRLQYRFRLYEHEALALRDNFVSIGVTSMLSPAFGRVGALVEVQPLTVLQLWGAAESATYFGTFNGMQSYASPLSDYRDATVQALGELPRGDARRPYQGHFKQLSVGANLLLAAGPLVLRNASKLAWFNGDLRAGDRVFYEMLLDLLVGDRGWAATNDLDVLYVTGGFAAGLRWTAFRAFFDETHFAPGEDPSRAFGTVHRLGPILAYTWVKPDGAELEPTAFLLVQWWLDSPNRPVWDWPRAVPFVVAGISLSGDLKPW